MLNNNLDLVLIMNSLRASDKKSIFASFAFGAAVGVSHPCFQTRCIELARRTRVSREGTLLGKSHFMRREAKDIRRHGRKTRLPAWLDGDAKGAVLPTGHF